MEGQLPSSFRAELETRSPFGRGNRFQHRTTSFGGAHVLRRRWCGVLAKVLGRESSPHHWSYCSCIESEGTPCISLLIHSFNKDIVLLLRARCHSKFWVENLSSTQFLLLNHTQFRGKVGENVLRHRGR